MIFRSKLRLGMGRASAFIRKTALRAAQLHFESLEDRLAPAAFTPGNIVVNVVGDGDTAGNAAVVTLREYTPTGDLVQSIVMPGTTSGAQHALRQIVTSTSEGSLNRSADGRFLTLVGYEAENAATVAGTSRVIARVDAFGNIDTSTAANVYTGAGSSIRAAVSYDGNQFWTAGYGTSAAYVRSFGTVGSSTNADLASAPINSVNTRNVVIGFDGRLYYATSAGASPGPGIYQFATPRPTSPSAETRIIAGSGAGIGGIVLIDMDANGTLTNGDRLYFADDAQGLQKSVFNGTTWSAATTVAAMNSLRGLTGVRVNGTAVQFYGTTFTTPTADSKLLSFLDDGNEESSWSVLVTQPGTLLGFRGVALAPSIATTISIADFSPSVTTVGTPVTFQATLTAIGAGSSAPPSGTVEFRDGTTVLATASFVNPGSGSSVTVSASAPSLPPGTYNVIAVFLPTGGYLGANSASKPLTVNASSTTSTTTTFNPLPVGPVAYGSAITFSGTVSNSATGTIFIRAGGPSGTLLATGAVTAGSFNVSSATTNTGSPSPIAAGEYNSANSNLVTAYFVGASGFGNSNSTGQNLTVSRRTLTINGLAAQNKTYDGTIVATVAGSPALVGTIIAGDSVSLSSGAPAYSFLDANAADNKPVTMTGYALSGPSAGNYQLALPTLTASITKAATATTLIVTPQATTGGMLVTFDAVVSAPGLGAGLVSGTIDFYDDATLLGSSAINAVGSATLTTSSLTIGSHPITATYSGDGNFLASTSDVVVASVTDTAAEPQVVSVTVNGDVAGLAGVQRSRVTSLAVVFDQPVELDADAFALALHTNQVSLAGVNLPGGYGSLPTSLAMSSGDNRTWIVTFVGNTDDGEFGSPFDGFSSIKNGVYDFTIDAIKVHPLGLPDVNMAANSTTTFHRLFGDITGVETPLGGTPNIDFLSVVVTNDNLALRAAFNNPSNYRPDLDFNGDGLINTADNLQFRSNFNRALTWRA